MDTIQDGEFCPLLKEPCIKHKCRWYKNIRGQHPQTGKEIDGWDCAIGWLPLLTVEVARHVNSAGAATESMRNEIVKRMDGPLPPQLEKPHGT